MKKRAKRHGPVAGVPGRSDPVVLLEEIFPGDTNSYGTAFGGRILALMDRAAGLAASRFARGHFVTVSLDALEFRAPVRQGEIAEIEARVVYTSAHTCGVKVRVSAIDKKEWERRVCCEGTIFMASLGPDGRPGAPIPRLVPASDEARAEWAEAWGIHQAMLARRAARREAKSRVNRGGSARRSRRRGSAR